MPQMKRCPRCQTAAALDASQCQQCGHAYRTRFTPQPDPQRAPTQTLAPPRAAPPARPLPARRPRAWLIAGLILCALPFVIGPLLLSTFARGAAAALRSGQARAARGSSVSAGATMVLIRWRSQNDYLHGVILGEIDNLSDRPLAYLQVRADHEVYESRSGFSLGSRLEPLYPAGVECGNSETGSQHVLRPGGTGAFGIGGGRVRALKNLRVVLCPPGTPYGSETPVPFRQVLDPR